MTLQELKRKTTVKRQNGYNCYLVTIDFYGKQYSCYSNNSLAWDRLDDPNLSDQQVSCSYTNKGAYEAFYEECKMKNGLGEYNY